MSETKIWLSSPHMGGTEQNYVNEAFDTNWIAPLGPNVNGFENDIESYFNNDKHVAALVSGTAAIHLGLQLLGVGVGDEVLCQSMTFSASANPIKYLGATPVFVDSESDTWNICPDLIEEAIKDRIKNGIKPKAIVAVHLYGMPYKVDEIQAISKKYEIPVLEDSAEALGSSYNGYKCGSFGEFAILSFNGNKIITTSGGGALLCNNEVLKKQAVFLATQAKDDAPHYQHSVIGYNYRMSNIVAGIGRGQMEVLDKHVGIRRRNYEFYRKDLENYESIQFLKEPKGYFANRWLTCIRTESFEQRETIRIALKQENIESRPLWKPMHKQPVFSKSLSFVNGISENLFEKGLCLPSGSNLVEEDLLRVVTTIKKHL